ncbi:MAG TPA: DUF1905 domain-containing protein [Trebonia sp.]
MPAPRPAARRRTARERRPHSPRRAARTPRSGHRASRRRPRWPARGPRDLSPEVRGGRTWRRPAPYLFVAMTPEESEDLREAARGLIDWGQVPVRVTIGDTEFTTALFPKDGRYLVPVKVAVQRAEAIGEGAIVEVVLRLNTAR